LVGSRLTISFPPIFFFTTPRSCFFFFVLTVYSLVLFHFPPQREFFPPKQCLVLSPFVCFTSLYSFTVFFGPLLPWLTSFFTPTLRLLKLVLRLSLFSGRLKWDTRNALVPPPAGSRGLDRGLLGLSLLGVPPPYWARVFAPCWGWFLFFFVIPLGFRIFPWGSSPSQKRARLFFFSVFFFRVWGCVLSPVPPPPCFGQFFFLGLSVFFLGGFFVVPQSRLAGSPWFPVGRGSR